MNPPSTRSVAFISGGHDRHRGRLGTTDEVAEVVAFLACAGSRYITGTTVHVDGGMSSAATVIGLGAS